MNIEEQAEAWALARRAIDALETIAQQLEKINDRERQKTL